MIRAPHDFDYDAESDALVVCFKELGPGSVAYSRPVKDGSVIIDYSDEGLVVQLEFLWASEQTGCHFSNKPSAFEGKVPFSMVSERTPGELHVHFSGDIGCCIGATSTRVKEVSLCLCEGILTGFRVAGQALA